jgi:hypothetical protein
MDRGIPTEENLTQMRQQSDPPVQYVVGTPKGRLTQLEAAPLKIPWQQARPSVQVKLLSVEQELFILVNSQARVNKERAIRQRRPKKLWVRLRKGPAVAPASETKSHSPGSHQTARVLR